MENQYNSYSWHQSHDQATVLLLVPYETTEEDVVVVIEKDCLLAGVRGQSLIIKGRLYGCIDSNASDWQLEPRSSRLSTRERTTSTISTTSTHFSYAFVSDPEISSSFAASLESGQVSDAEEPVTPSPAYSSPLSLSSDERTGALFSRNHNITATSNPVSPGNPHRSLTSSFSSLDSLHAPHSGRLLTLHLEKEQPAIWPSLVVGPVSESLSPCIPNPTFYDRNSEHNYNMDPTSLLLIALELYDIRRDREEAFECLVRAWHQGHMPPAAMRLVAHYVPLHASAETSSIEDQRGTLWYYSHCIGGAKGLAQLYLEAGLLHLEGSASVLLSSSYSTLSSIRLSPQEDHGDGGADGWRRDRDAANRYFERARALQPTLDIPVLPPEAEMTEELEMPLMEIHPTASDSVFSEESPPVEMDAPALRRRRKKEELAVFNEINSTVDNSWYLYIPGLVDAGTALLVVGVVGALSFSSWRRNQGS